MSDPESDFSRQEVLELKAKAFRVASETAAALAARHGAEDRAVAEAFANAREVHGEAWDPHQPRTAEEQAEMELELQRTNLHFTSALALYHGVEVGELTESIDQMIEVAMQLHRAQTPADLGFA